MLKNAHLLAKIGSDTAENEQHFAEHFADRPAWGRRAGAGGDHGRRGLWRGRAQAAAHGRQ